MGSFRTLVRQALAELGVRRLALAIHDASFPGKPDEDLGRGAPFSRGARRLLMLLAELGFDALQLGPQGEMARDNPCPYDTTVMSRCTLSLALSPLMEAGWLSEATLGALVHDSPRDRVHHRDAFDAHGRARAEIRSRHRERLAAGDREAHALAERLTAFRAAHRWLEAYTELDPLSPADYAFDQLLAHEQHAAFRDWCRERGLALYGDCQIGMSPQDARYNQALLLPGYALGAPPSRTNPDGQPWGYPVLDPDRGAVRFVRDRMAKLFGELDAVRIDHPHGLVCPWVYRTDEPGAHHAVQHGARLLSAPDLPDHPALARYAVVRPDQLDRSQPRHADGWVRELSEEQVDRYALLIDAVVDCAKQHGRASDDLVCEVLSTCPHPLLRVMARHGLGRFRVTQKANLDDPNDGYRSDNARPEDWIMVGTHDTNSIWRLVDSWSADERQRQARFVAERLGGGSELLAQLDDPGRLAQAKLAELFSSRAENVMIFFADLFGYRERYNLPGTFADDNWTLRVRPDFEQTFAHDAAARRAMDMRSVLALALRAKKTDGAMTLATKLERMPLPVIS